MKIVALFAMIFLISQAGCTVEENILVKINEYRASEKNHPPLALNEKLSEVALAHAQYLEAKNTCSHTGVGGSKPKDRVIAAGIKEVAVGENVAASDNPTATEFFKLWRDSSGHRKNMLGDWTEIGIGVVGRTAVTVFTKPGYCANDADADKLAQMINDYRASRGLPKLEVLETANKIAREHAKWMEENDETNTNRLLKAAKKDILATIWTVTVFQETVSKPDLMFAKAQKNPAISSPRYSSMGVAMYCHSTVIVLVG